jgi:hypothetical protein
MSMLLLLACGSMKISTTCSGFVVMVGGCPILRGSKLQTEMALSTIQSEYIALSESMKHLVHLND